LSRDFVQRLVDRTRAGAKPTLRPAVRPMAPVAAEPPLIVDVELDGGEPATRERVAPVGPAPGRRDPADAEVAWEMAARMSIAADADAAVDVPLPLMPPSAQACGQAPSPRPFEAGASEAAAFQSAEVTAASGERAAPPRPVQPAAPRRPPARVAARTTAGVSAPPARRQEAEDAPIIRVHIGRVDVRAVPPPPPAPRRPPEPLPSVALGRYLDERGRRR